jgi:phage-related protein
MKDGTGPGGKLADILGKVWDVLKPVIDFIRNNKAVVATFVGVVITLTAAFAALNLVLAINPFTLLIIGIAAVAAGLVYAYKHSDQFRSAVGNLWNNVLKPFGAWLGEHLPGVLRVVGKAFLTNAQIIVTALDFIFTAVTTVFGGILRAAAKAFGWIPGLGDDIKRASKGFDAMKNAAGDAIDSVQVGLQDAQDSLDKLGKKNPKPKITPPASGPSIRAAENVAASLKKLDKVHAKPTVSLGGVGSVLNSLANLGAGLDAAIRKSSTLSRTRIGANAKGTDNWRGGLTWVGEEGPELLNVSKGAQIIPNHKLGTVGRDIAATTTASAPAASASSTASGPSTMRITHLDPLLRFIEVAVEDGIDGLVAHSEEIAGMSY